LPPLILAVGGALPMPHARMTGTAWDRRKEDYAYTRELDDPGWAWEFLRRNEAFRRDCRINRVGHPAAIRHVSGALLYRPRRRFLAAEEWGLELFADPDKTALEADVFWLPKLKTHAVQCQCHPVAIDAPGALSLDMFCGRRGILISGDKEHIVICGPGYSASMIIGHGTLLFGKTSVTFTHSGLVCLSRHYQTTRMLAQMTSKSANNNCRASQKSSKLLEYLIALDGRLAGLSYRETALVLYGRKCVESSWSGDTRGYKSKVARACKSGFELMNNGYLKLL
jgi:Uncharacterized conserved protein (DUF2285)/Family of unknown function (DUF6499)